jgi:hypothetical protein
MAASNRTIGAGVVCMAMLLAMPAFAGKPALTPQDYFEIRALIEGYPVILDTCVDSGYAYADQYTPDGTFGVSSQWGDDGYVWFTGRDALAVAAGGGPDGCHKKSSRYHHLALSPIIAATASGAHARSTLLMITDAAGDKPAKIEWQGGYEDSLVRTRNGWRFKSRRHVWPGYDWPATAAEMAERLAKQRAND